MFAFYKANIEYLRELAVAPDHRRYAVEAEGARHYIDLEHYAVIPFDSIPRNWNKACELFTEDSLNAFGIVPWHVVRMYYRLENSFISGSAIDILRNSAELGHYLADAHVPLHSTENYNGQLTGQKGIHAFWESRLPELFFEEYDFFMEEAAYIADVQEEIWQVVYESHSAVDSVLTLEKSLSLKFDEDRRYGYEERGYTLVRTQSKAYSRAYHDALNGMVERRMKRAVWRLASFWFTAWVNAGQPELEELGKRPVEVDSTLSLDGHHRGR